jgi:hypothetical protein
MNIGPNKLTTSKQDTIEYREIHRETRCNLFTRNHTYGYDKLKHE